MFCISHQITDPYFNIASEEYLLKNFSDDIFMLYVNEPSVIIGKHQNAFAEINHQYVSQNNIKVVRRLSGGGTVFHDSGNLNFCFIRNGKEGNLIDFKRFTQPIIEVLQKLDIPAERSGRNDLIINGLKFSGNAEHVFKNRTLHHGTILFSSRLENLRAALKVNPDLFQDKAVKSVRSKVTNISEHLSSAISIDEFKALIVSHIVSSTNKVRQYEFTEAEHSEIQDLVEKKYKTWEWNYGYSPRFTFKNQGFVNNQFIEVELKVEKGIIRHADIKLNKQLTLEISKALQDQPYKEDMIVNKVLPSQGFDSKAILSFLF